MLALLMGTGIWLTVRSGFFQFTHFPHAMKTVFRAHGGSAPGRGTVSSFQAVSTALAATVGTGNIAGVAGAIALGGPGALFWMWVSALVGMATKYAEVVLAVRFRRRNEHGDWVGGPMYYITAGLGSKWRWLAFLFAVFGSLAAFGIGNMAQINTIASSLAVLARNILPASQGMEPHIKAGVGVVIAALSGLVLIGGLKRIGSVSERLVPAACIAYVLCCLAVILFHAERLDDVFRDILNSAFHPYAIAGGAVGISAQQAMRCGVSRGVFSNEAGMGSASIAHAAADTNSPVRQGLYGIFEVFVDTILTCSLTGLSVLVSGVPVVYGQSTGAELTIAAFASTFGDRTASIIVAAGITLFAGATILSWAFYGMRCAEYLLGARAVLPYQMLYLLFTVLGAVLELSFVWEISETLNGLMAIPNLIAIFALSGVVARATQTYRKRLHDAK